MLSALLIGGRYFESSCDNCLHFTLVANRKIQINYTKFSHDFYHNGNMLAVLCSLMTANFIEWVGQSKMKLTIFGRCLCRCVVRLKFKLL